MMFFGLEPEDGSGNIYYFKTTIKDVDDFDDLASTKDFEDFMWKMETDRAPYAGVHDIGGNNRVWSYQSYEIKNFELAIQMWYDWFKTNGLLTDDSTVVVKSISSYDDVI